MRGGVAVVVVVGWVAEKQRERGRGEKEREEGREGSADLLFSNPATKKPPLRRPLARSLTLGLPLHQCVTLELRV